MYKTKGEGRQGDKDKGREGKKWTKKRIKKNKRKEGNHTVKIV